VDYRWDETFASGLGNDLDRLVYLAHVVGNDFTLFQAGGGGVSLKRRERDFAGREVDVLWVKGTGAPLRALRREDLTPLRLDEVRLLEHRPALAEEDMRDYLVSCRLDPRAPTPSVQSPVYAFIPKPWVVFTLDFASQALTNTSRKDAFIRELYGDEVAYVGYVRPGFPLGKAIQSLGGLGEAKGLALGKHGFVTWGATAKECYDSLFSFVRRAEDFLRDARARKEPLARRRHADPGPERRTEAARRLLPGLRGLLSRGRRVVLHYDSSAEAVAFAGSELARQAHRRGMSAPEYILHCGRAPLHVDAELSGRPPDEAMRFLREAVDGFEADYRTSFAKHGRGTEMLGPAPRLVLLPGLGIVAASSDAARAAQAARCYRHVTRVIAAAEAIDQFRFLDEAGAFEFEYWPLELERLRKPEKELARRVALITGAGGGMGRVIAERFALEGAHVVLTDLDGAAAERAAAEIGARTGDPSRAIGLRADATSEAETAAAFSRAVLEFGGLDLLVCNAGFVQPGPVDRTDRETWERHFDVNLTGYFLAVREAVRILKAQGTGGAILLNASKAAFSAPAENAAYAASKAAVAHLARNLAVELAPAGVRVNYVNADFIDTPMIRKMARERAARKGITEDEQLEEYRKRNLLKVGPIPPEAVAEAALFLASDRARYTTGGVLTVDGGLPDAMPR
jgi:rhamnulose-1-phosphate aldolase/alcohol dehydrogenase